MAVQMAAQLKVAQKYKVKISAISDRIQYSHTMQVGEKP